MQARAQRGCIQVQEIAERHHCVWGHMLCIGIPQPQPSHLLQLRRISGIVAPNPLR